MSKAKEYTWFLEPLNSRTNKVFGQDLGEENSHNVFICNDGKQHNLWECTFNYANSAWESKEDLDLKFKVWNRQGGHGNQTRECTAIFRKPSLRKKTEAKKTSRKS